MTPRPIPTAPAAGSSFTSRASVGRVQPSPLPHTRRGQDTVGHPARAPVRVLLCEDQQIYLAGLRSLLAGHPELTVVGEAASVTEACLLAERSPCQVAVVRQGLVCQADYEPLRQLSGRGIAVLVLAETDARLDLVRALRAGARGYLSRRLSDQQLLEGIRALARDEPAFDGVVAQHLVNHLMEQPARPVARPATGPLGDLTERQRVVALLVAEGLSNDEIAARLHVSRTTVKSHLAQVMRRLELHSRTQLAVLVNRSARAGGVG